MPVDQINAKKVALGPESALALTRSVDRIVATKGKRIVEFDLKKDRPDDANLLGVLIGPSGKLRAPTLRVGRTLLVGFDPAIYEKYLR